MPNYFFGSFQINQNSGGLGYFFESKNLDIPKIRPVEFPIARRDGTKKSGEFVDPRQVDILLKIVGSSRTDLISRIDALQQALSLRSQSLCIHEDGRIFNSVDCISADAKLKAGKIVACDVPISFKTYDPYAYASTSSSYDTGTVALTSANSLWNFPAINVVGGGTIYSYPLLHLINKTSTGSTTLSAGLTSGNNYTSISVNATGFSASIGDKITITHGGTTQTLNVTTAFSVGATSIAVTSFTAGANYVSGDACTKVTQWNSIQISQVQDSETLSANSTASVPLPSANGDYVDVTCDPASGMSIIANASGKQSDPVGIFPVMEPGTTTFNIGISCSSAVSAEAVISWNARYLS
jgi:hypothetical protein